jgi:hypothetical protein
VRERDLLIVRDTVGQLSDGVTVGVVVKVDVADALAEPVAELAALAVAEADAVAEPDAVADAVIVGVDAALTVAIEVEHGAQRRDVTNYDEVRSSIIERLETLRDDPARLEEPVIYHLDVAAMYPNIILTNRLQPSSMVTSEDTCASCDYNHDANRCKRALHWRWRGEYFPATRAETDQMRAQLLHEVVEGKPYADLPREAQTELLKARLKKYCQTVYKRVKDTVETDKAATVCQRENPFYVNTVRAFRDRRYEYKGKTKEWGKKLGAAEKAGNALDAELARARVVLYDSLQLAHKCILNSFYGYVMRLDDAFWLNSAGLWQTYPVSCISAPNPLGMYQANSQAGIYMDQNAGNAGVIAMSNYLVYIQGALPVSIRASRPAAR